MDTSSSLLLLLLSLLLFALLPSLLPSLLLLMPVFAVEKAVEVIAAVAKTACGGGRRRTSVFDNDDDDDDDTNETGRVSIWNCRISTQQWPCFAATNRRAVVLVIALLTLLNPCTEIEESNMANKAMIMLFLVVVDQHIFVRSQRSEWPST